MVPLEKDKDKAKPVKCMSRSSLKVAGCPALSIRDLDNE